MTPEPQGSVEHGERDPDLAMLKREVDSLQIQLLSTSKPWYKQASTLISLFALIFSSGTSLISWQRVAEQDRQSWKQELRGLIIELVTLPLKGAELNEKYKNQKLLLGSVSSVLNQQSLILADQASVVVQKIPDLVTAQEYLALAGAFHNGGQLERAKAMRDRAIERSSNPIETITALRQLGGMAFQRGDLAGGRTHFQEALNVFKKSAPDTDAGLITFTDGYTEMYFAQVEATATQCKAFEFHIAEARKLGERLPPGSKEQLLGQISETESYGCPPVFP